jgi:carbon monoxide dehydrogenase subunit G
MKVQLDRTFAVPAAAERAWVVLQDIEKVAACMPGARITERTGERSYKGTVAVKFGPASMSFRGDVELLALEPEYRSLRLAGKGTDSTGTSAASMDLTAKLVAGDGAQCSLVGHSEVSMSGKAAAFGARMIDSVADQILKQFAANFAAQVQALPDEGAAASTAPAASATPPAAAAATTSPVAATASTPPAPEASARVATPAAPAAARAPAPAPAPAPPPSAEPLNGIALLWAVFRDWLRSLFAAKKT